MEKTETCGVEMRKRMKTYYLSYKGKRHPFFKSKSKGLKIGKKYYKFTNI